MRIIEGSTNEEPFERLVLWHRVRDPRLMHRVLRLVRKWVDGVENYTQYIVRRLYQLGIVLDYSANISPTNDGYVVTVTVRVRGLTPELYRKLVETTTNKDVTG